MLGIPNARTLVLAVLTTGVAGGASPARGQAPDKSGRDTIFVAQVGAVRPTTAELGESAAVIQVLESLRGFVPPRIRRDHVPVVILDSGWPSIDDRDSSVARLNRMMDTVRAAWGLGARDPQTPRVGETFLEPHHPHVRTVAAVLEPLRATLAGRDSAVQLIYVPLVADADGSAVLAELLHVGALLAAKRTKYARRCPWSDQPAVERACLQRMGGVELTFAQRHALQERIDELERVAERGGESVFFGSSIVLDAVWTLLEAHSLLTGTMAFVSASWTAKPLAVNWNMSPRLSGRVVAIGALGNDGRQMSSGNMMHLGYLSAETPYVLGASNVRRSGVRMCRTAYMHADLSDRVLGFPGVVDGGTCGTSFTAPRIAWFLALWETMRPDDSAWSAPLLGKRIERFRQRQGNRAFDPLAFYQFLLQPSR